MELLIILVFTLVNGVFAMSELAVVSARKARLQQLADDGDPRAKATLELANAPNRFLSTTQIGITLIGIGAGAFGGATIAEQLAAQIAQIPLLAPFDEVIAFVIVVAITTYLSLIFGELVPKRLAMRQPEQIAMLITRPMNLLSAAVSPFVRFLSFSTDLVLRVLGIDPNETDQVTEAEILAMVQQGAAEGVFTHTEPEMVEGVLRLDEFRVNSLMTPRKDIIGLDIDAPTDEIRLLLLNSPHSAYPVYREDLDNPLGFVRVKNLLNSLLTAKPLDLNASLEKVLFIPETASASRALETFKANGCHFALVVDEYGGITGLITLNDLIEEIVGDMDQQEPDAIPREDGSWLVDGRVNVYRLEELFPDLHLPENEEGSYTTISGFVMYRLGKIPMSAEHFTWGDFRFEVMDMDGNTIDKVMVNRLATSASEDNTKP